MDALIAAETLENWDGSEVTCPDNFNDLLDTLKKDAEENTARSIECIKADKDVPAHIVGQMLAGWHNTLDELIRRADSASFLAASGVYHRINPVLARWGDSDEYFGARNAAREVVALWRRTKQTLECNLAAA